MERWGLSEVYGERPGEKGRPRILNGRQNKRGCVQTWSRNVKAKHGVIQTRWMRDKNRDGAI